MALTTNSEVWKIIAVIFVLLTGLFTMFFYFSRISIVVVTGIILIIVTERMSENYKERMKEYKLSPRIRAVIGYALLVFWISISYLALNASFQDFDDAIGILNQQEDDHTLLKYFKTVQPLVPEIIADQVNILTVRDTQETIVSRLTALLGQISFFVFYGLLIIPLMFYTYFRRKEAIWVRITSLVPEKYRAGFVHSKKTIGKDLHDYLEGKIIESIVISVICCLGFFIIGLKAWLLLGLVAGFLNIVPLIGPFIGAIPAVVVSFTDEPWVAGAVIGTIAVAQLVDNFYLIPFMISSKVRLDPLLVIMLILIGAQLLGMMGMLFAIPVYLIYKIVLQQAYKELVKIYR